MDKHVIDTIKSFGFDVYIPFDKRWNTFAYYTDGTNIGYIEDSRLVGLRISTVHVPNNKTGTGFSIDEPFRLTREYLERAFAAAPSWWRGPTPIKYKSWSDFASSRTVTQLHRV